MEGVAAVRMRKGDESFLCALLFSSSTSAVFSPHLLFLTFVLPSLLHLQLLLPNMPSFLPLSSPQVPLLQSSLWRNRKCFFICESSLEQHKIREAHNNV